VRLPEVASDRPLGRLSVGLGIVALGSAASLAAFFAAGSPFGTLNDLGNGAIGVAAGVLAWQLRRRGPAAQSVLSKVATAAAVAGGLVSVLGSVLVTSGATGFFFAGLVSNLGFALIGLWLLDLNRSAMRVGGSFPHRLSYLGLATGAAMALGLAAAPGIAMGLDSADTAPAWAWIGSVGWIGVYLLLPAWCIWFGRTLLAGRRLGPAEPSPA
jgi:hypothetical protein